jgi:hypothetical protein
MEIPYAEYAQYSDIAQNLEILAEEAAEIGRIKSKCIRFGLDDFHPKNGEVNRVALAKEIGNLLVMVNILLAHGVITHDNIIAGMDEKRTNLSVWYNHKNDTI